jgi:hypothetical protein
VQPSPHTFIWPVGDDMKFSKRYTRSNPTLLRTLNFSLLIYILFTTITSGRKTKQLKWDKHCLLKYLGGCRDSTGFVDVVHPRSIVSYLALFASVNPHHRSFHHKRILCAASEHAHAACRAQASHQSSGVRCTSAPQRSQPARTPLPKAHNHSRNGILEYKHYRLWCYELVL